MWKLFDRKFTKNDIWQETRTQADANIVSHQGIVNKTTANYNCTHDRIAESQRIIKKKLQH